MKSKGAASVAPKNISDKKSSGGNQVAKLRRVEDDGRPHAGFYKARKWRRPSSWGGCLSPERVPLSENNWLVPGPIHQSDSAWPHGNE